MGRIGSGWRTREASCSPSGAVTEFGSFVSRAGWEAGWPGTDVADASGAWPKIAGTSWAAPLMEGRAWAGCVIARTALAGAAETGIAERVEVTDWLGAGARNATANFVDVDSTPSRPGPEDGTGGWSSTAP